MTIYIVTWNFRRWEFDNEEEKTAFLQYWKLKGVAWVFKKAVSGREGGQIQHIDPRVLYPRVLYPLIRNLPPDK